MAFAKIKVVAQSNPPSANSMHWDPLSKVIQNALIVDTISKYIGLADMINCRSVNNLWKNEWTPVIQKRSQFHLCLTNKIAMLVKDLRIGLRERPNSDWNKRGQSYFATMDQSEINIRFSIFIQWISRNVQNFPCSKIRIGTQIFKRVDQGVRDNLFRGISNVVTELYLENSFGDSDFPLSNFENLVLEFCNLKALKLRMWHLDGPHLDMALSFVGKVTKLASKLDTFKLVSFSKSFDKFLIGCIHAIRTPKQIKSLHVSGTITDYLLEKLTESKLALKELEVCFERRSNFSSKTFESFMKSQNNSLKKLRLGTGSVKRTNLKISIPQMSRVHLLDIGLFEGVNFTGLSFQQAFPKLKLLKMNGEGNVITDSNPFMKAVHTVEEVDLRSFAIAHNAVLHACTMFANVKKLSIPCLGDMQALNSASMTSLEDLTLWIKPQFWSDQTWMNITLTGYSWYELREITTQQLWQQTEQLPREPLALLQRVKTLRLEYASMSNKLCILGPLKLQSLKCLDLRVTPTHGINKHHKISKPVLEKMRQKFAVLLNEESLIHPIVHPSSLFT